MAILGNWTVKEANEEVLLTWGRVAIFGRNNSNLEISFTAGDADEDWHTIHQFPPVGGEIFNFEVPTETLIRVVPTGPPVQWAFSRFNNPSG